MTLTFDKPGLSTDNMGYEPMKYVYRNNPHYGICGKMHGTDKVDSCFDIRGLSTNKVGLSKNVITAIDKPGLLTDKPILSKHKPTLPVPRIFP